MVVHRLLTAVASLVEHRPWASVVAARGLNSCGSRALEHRLSSCALTQLLCGMWDLPRPGIEPVPSEVAGGVLTPEPPGKPPTRILTPQKAIISSVPYINIINRQQFYHLEGREQPKNF